MPKADGRRNNSKLPYNTEIERCLEQYFPYNLGNLNSLQIFKEYCQQQARQCMKNKAPVESANMSNNNKFKC